jgi:chaperone modulatory protein CbpM
METTVITGVLMDEQSNTLSFTQVCHRHHLSESELRELLDYGLLGDGSGTTSPEEFNAVMIKRIESACRLQTDLGVNSPGVVLVLELRDELAAVYRELEVLRRHMASSDGLP